MYTILLPNKLVHVPLPNRYCWGGKPGAGALGLAGVDDCGEKDEEFGFDEDCGAKGEVAFGFDWVDAGFVELLVSPGLYANFQS